MSHFRITGYLANTSALIADLFGTRATGYENKFRSAQSRAIEEMKTQADKMYYKNAWFW